MFMKTVTVDLLSGPALDWVIAKAEGNAPHPAHAAPTVSSDWALAGPRIESRLIDVSFVRWDEDDNAQAIWGAESYTKDYFSEATSAVLAGMRTYAKTLVGDNAQVPEHLVRDAAVV